MKILRVKCEVEKDNGQTAMVYLPVKEVASYLQHMIMYHLDVEQVKGFYKKYPGMKTPLVRTLEDMDK